MHMVNIDGNSYVVYLLKQNHDVQYVEERYIVKVKVLKHFRLFDGNLTMCNIRNKKKCLKKSVVSRRYKIKGQSMLNELYLNSQFSCGFFFKFLFESSLIAISNTQSEVFFFRKLSIFHNSHFFKFYLRNVFLTP